MSASVPAAQRQGERRAPMAVAVIVDAGLYFLIPEDFRVAEGVFVLAYPVMLLTFLAVLMIGDPGRIDRQSRWLRITTGLMVALMTVATALSTLRLVVGILQKADFATPGQLLQVGSVVWISNVIAFAFWYWHLDRGGPAVRARGEATRAPAFRFIEEDLPDLVGAHWYPQFIDYLALSFNTSTAFSPTDVSAIRHWSKAWLMMESAISLALVVLVVARAINIL